LDKIAKKQKNLKSRIEETKQAYKDWKISISEYQDQLSKLNKEYNETKEESDKLSEAIKIINDDLLDYEKKIEEINKLDLDDTEYRNIIWWLKKINVEARNTKTWLDNVLGTSKEVIKWAGKTLLNTIGAVARVGSIWSKIFGDKKEMAENFWPPKPATKSWLDFAQGVSSAVRTIKDSADEIGDIPDLTTWGGSWWKIDLIKIERERQEKLLKEQALANIKSIQQSEDTEIEKAKKIVAINEKLEKDFKKLKSEELEITTEKAKEIIEEEEEKQKQILELEKAKNKELSKLAENEEYLQKESGKIFDEVITEKEKRIEDFIWKIEEANKRIGEIDQELEDLETGRVETLGKRNVEILEEEAKIKEKLNKLQREGIDLKQAERIGEKTLKQLWGGTISWVDVTDLLEAVELNNQLKSITEERALIERNATDEELNQQKKLAELSPTERYLQDFETRKTILEQEKVLKQQEITDLELQKNEEKLILDKFTADKLELDNAYRDKVAEIEAGITDDLQDEVNKRKLILEDLRVDVAETKQALESLSMAKADSGQTIQSQNNFWDVNITNQQDAESLLNRLRP